MRSIVLTFASFNLNFIDKTIDVAMQFYIRVKNDGKKLIS